jgi:hypothetical protein
MRPRYSNPKTCFAGLCPDVAVGNGYLSVLKCGMNHQLTMPPINACFRPKPFAASGCSVDPAVRLPDGDHRRSMAQRYSHHEVDSLRMACRSAMSLNLIADSVTRVRLPIVINPMCVSVFLKLTIYPTAHEKP